MPTLKQSGSLCPRCGGKCAEHAQLNQSMRWTCNTCGAGGQIEAETEQAVEEAKEPHRHWRDVAGCVDGSAVHASIFFHSLDNHG